MQMEQAEKVMARRAFRNFLVIKAVQWALIIGISRSLKKAVERELARRDG